MFTLKFAVAFVISIALLALLAMLLRLIFKVPLWVLTRMSGWRELSEKFPDTQADPESNKFRFCSVRLGGISYKSCVNVLVSKDAVSLHIGLPFRDFHPNIRLPRNRLLPRSGATMWLQEFLVDDDGLTIWLDKRVARQLGKT